MTIWGEQNSQAWRDRTLAQHEVNLNAILQALPFAAPAVVTHTHHWSGSGAPTALTVPSAVAGDVYWRIDTPAVSNQRLYICTAAGTWTGIL